MGRRPYRTTMRPWRDSEDEVTVHWYSVPITNGTLPYPSRINSLQWRDMQINPSPVGEVSCEPQIFDGWGRIIPPNPGDHICGTREDFEFGGLRNTSAPALVRGPDGIPTCCRGPLGALVVGGYGVVGPDGYYAGTIIVLGGVGLLDEDLGIAGITLGGTAFRKRAIPPYEVSTVVPRAWATRWTGPGGGGTVLESLHPRGEAGPWTLTVPVGPWVFTTAGWDGTGVRVFDLISGPVGATAAVTELL